MILLGIILLVLGAVFGISILTTLGTLLLVIGLILLLVGYFHGPVFGERRHWF